MRLSTVKRTMMASALAVATAVAGNAGFAQAFSFGEGDLVLAIYGNNTEALYDLGKASTILTSGGAGISNLDVSAGLTAAQVGTNAVKYTLFGWDLSLPNGQITAATAFAPSAITGTKDFNTQFNNSVGFSALSFTGDTISKTDPSGRSFSQNLNVSGSGQFDGAWPVAMQGSLGQLLNVMQGNVETNSFTQVGRVLLTANGLLTVGNPGPSPVPLPAAVVLFGTGVIGLIGIARRRMNS